jgi:hypothetical protein
MFFRKMRLTYIMALWADLAPEIFPVGGIVEHQKFVLAFPDPL